MNMERKLEATLAKMTKEATSRSLRRIESDVMLGRLLRRFDDCSFAFIGSVVVFIHLW